MYKNKYSSKIKRTLTEEVEAHFRHAQHRGVRKQKISRFKDWLWRPDGFLIE